MAALRGSHARTFMASCFRPRPGAPIQTVGRKPQCDRTALRPRRKTEETRVGGPDRPLQGIQSAPVLLQAVFARGPTTEKGCGRKAACRSIVGEPDKQSRSP